MIWTVGTQGKVGSRVRDGRLPVGYSVRYSDGGCIEISEITTSELTHVTKNYSHPQNYSNKNNKYNKIQGIVGYSLAIEPFYGKSCI